MEVIPDAPTKIDPLWKRVLYFVGGLLLIPLAVFILGLLAGALWRFFLWGFNVLG